MDKKFLKGVLAGAVAALMLCIPVFSLFCLPNNNKTDSKSNIIESDAFKKKFNDINNLITTNYLDADKITDKEKEDGIYRGMIEAIGDKYAEYYNPEEYKESMESTMGQYGGIGTYVTQENDTGKIVIVNPFKGEPAASAGIKSGDIIVEVDGKNIFGMKLDEVTNLMKGEPGTKVRVKISREGEMLEFEIERELIDVITVNNEIIEDGTIGYIYISAFEMVTTEQFIKALDDVEKKGIKGLIIDLRNNGGGVLDSAIKILDRILPEGLVLYTETKKGRSEEYFSSADESLDMPLCVLINEYSASASEVLAGAVKDFGAGKLVGTKSYGKGVVQTIFPMHGEDGVYAVKLTTQRYFTPKGINIDGKGIVPDVEVEIDEKKVIKKDGLYYDTQMQEAVKIIKESIK